MQRPAAVLSLAVLLSAGCTAGDLGEITIPPDPDDPGLGSGDDVGGEGIDPSPDPVDVEEPETMFHGHYEIVTTMDVAGSGVLGTHVGGTLVLLSEFHENPAGTILGLLALYDVPIISTIYDLLPGFLEDELEDWLNDAIFDRLFDGVPAIEQGVVFIDDVASISRNVEMTSDLELSPPMASGGMRGIHKMRGFGFTFRELHAFAEVPQEIIDLTAAEPHATLEILDSPNPALPQGLLEIQSHSFAIPYGEMLIQALDELVYQPAGVSSLGGLLESWIDCASVANSVGDNCVLGVCVSDLVSVSELTELCTAGLDVIGFIVEESVRALEFDLVRFDNGRCQLYDVGYEDTAGDFEIDAVTDGEWDLSIEWLGTSYVVANDFEGRRVGDL